MHVFFDFSFSTERIDALEAMTITQVSCGKMHTVVLNDKGQLYSFGSNSRGQLGLGTAEETPRKSPR